ncbi:methyltransferase family protein [Paracoccus jiaweipingae]|uniref:methyltransferase family protein n=1 Tax=unclassified Paracoccus (in: a-proteobacteria) TaxID=2688777 RepID=UPI0037A50360
MRPARSDHPVSGLIDLPPVWLAGFAALAFVAGRVLPVDSTLQWVIGWPVIFSALVLMAAAAVQIVMRHSTLHPHRDARALVTGGAYLISRNPIYLADALLLAGLCLVFSAPYALPVLVPLFMLVLTRRFILPEEARLAARFPHDYAAYRAETRRWI